MIILLLIIASTLLFGVSFTLSAILLAGIIFVFLVLWSMYKDDQDWRRRNGIYKNNKPL